MSTTTYAPTNERGGPRQEAAHFSNQEQVESTNATADGKRNLDAGTTNAGISYFNKVSDLAPLKSLTVMEFVRSIRSDEHAQVIAKVREIAARGNKDATYAAKLRHLPAVSLSGVSDGLRAQAFVEGRFQHSGWLQIDLDGKDLDGKDPVGVRDLLGQDLHILAACLSPTGTGVKAIMRVPVAKTPDEHTAAWVAASRYVSEQYGLKTDGQTKDSGRLFFCTHDPAAIVNDAVEELPVTAPLVASQSRAAKQAIDPRAYLPDTSTNEITATEAQDMLACIPPRPEYNQWLKISTAVWDALGEVEGTAALQRWSPEEKPGEYAEKFKHRLQDVRAGTLVMIAKQHGYVYRRNSTAVATRPSPPPIRSSASDVPAFPIECIPGIAGEMAREIGRVTTSMNEPLACATVLGVISASIGAGLEVNTGGERRTRGNLYILGILESGTGKGETYTLAAEPFVAAEAEAIKRFDMSERPGLVADQKIAEVRSKKLCNEAAKEPDRHARAHLTQQFREAEEEFAEIQHRLNCSPKWKVGDVTKEKLAMILQGQPGEATASMSSEARGIFNVIKGKYSKDGGDEDLYCSAYSGDGVSYDRVGRPTVTLRRPCLTALWLVQPDSAQKAFGEDAFTESGLLPRFLVFDPKAEPQERTVQPAPIPPATKAAWAELVRSLTTYRQQGDNPKTVAVSAGAGDFMNKVECLNVRHRRRDGVLRDISTFVARWTENAWKLALVIHAARHGAKAHLAELDLTTAKAAVRVMNWFSDRQLEILSCGRTEKAKKRLNALVALLAEAKGEISFGKLRHSHGFDEEEIKRLQSTFPNAFRIEERKPEIGRPSLVATNKKH